MLNNKTISECDFCGSKDRVTVLDQYEKYSSDWVRVNGKEFNQPKSLVYACLQCRRNYRKTKKKSLVQAIVLLRAKAEVMVGEGVKASIGALDRGNKEKGFDAVCWKKFFDCKTVVKIVSHPELHATYLLALSSELPTYATVSETGGMVAVAIGPAEGERIQSVLLAGEKAYGRKNE